MRLTALLAHPRARNTLGLKPALASLALILIGCTPSATRQDPPKPVVPRAPSTKQAPQTTAPPADSLKDRTSASPALPARIRVGLIEIERGYVDPVDDTKLVNDAGAMLSLAPQASFRGGGVAWRARSKH